MLVGPGTAVVSFDAAPPVAYDSHTCAATPRISAQGTGSRQRRPPTTRRSTASGTSRNSSGWDKAATRQTSTATRRSMRPRGHHSTIQKAAQARYHCALTVLFSVSLLASGRTTGSTATASLALSLIHI